jgi:hypothetical protein
MQDVGRADDLLYFKCPITKQMRCPVNAYVFSVPDDAFIKIRSSYSASLSNLYPMP